jgi:adenosylhomocysteinase
VGPAIQLIEGEKLAAISALLNGNVRVGGSTPQVVDEKSRRIVAETWNEHFLD